MGQKSTKHKDTDGEPSPSPRKSPKHSRSSRSSSRERTPPPGAERPTTVADSGGGLPRREVVEEIQVSTTARKSETKPERQSHKVSHRQSREQNPVQNGDQLMENGDDQKENVPDTMNQMIIEKMSSSPRTPAKVNGDTTLSPINMNESCISNHVPQATSTPAPNGVISTGQFGADSDNDQTDDEDEAFNTTDNQFQYHDRSPSSGSLASQSTTSSNKRSQSEFFERNPEVNYGKFYTASYLEGNKANYLKRSSLNSKNAHKSPHFHRPVNFSYSTGTPDFLKNKKSGMAQLATGGKVIVKRTRRASSPSELKNEEAVRMSMFPSGKPPKPNEVTKIEREDWPGPPSPAAILPEIMRKRRKSRGEEEEEEEDKPQEDPKITKEIEEISKFKDTSGLGSIIYKELSERKMQPVKPLDPWKSSRVPSAKYEPRYSTRFQSPMFASPSRFLDRPRRSWDDSDIHRGYRTISTSANYPVPKPGYGSYGLTPRAATLPVSGFYGGALYDFHYFDYDESAHEDGKRKGAYTSTSTMNTDHGSRSHISSIHDGPGLSLLTLQRSTWHTEAEPPVYSYDKLKISNFELPKDTDRNMLEIHLNNTDFEELFKMDREEFYRLAEWKRNDIKRKLDLF